MTATPPKRICIKHYATGKFRMYVDGGTEYDDKITRALERSGFVTATVDEASFRRHLSELGVPQSVIDATVQSIDVIDDTYDLDEAPRY